jgi:hypothetical protein
MPETRDPVPDPKQELQPGTPAFELWCRCIDGDEDARRQVRRGLFLAAVAAGRPVVVVEQLLYHAEALGCGCTVVEYAAEIEHVAAGFGWVVEAQWRHGRVDIRVAAPEGHRWACC